MANGDRLDDNKMTVAYNRAPLNSHLTITNIRTGQTVTAKVTDRGGHENHGKIIDLSLATKNALGCGDICRVEIAL
jgi:rare lipoprotein A